MERLRAQGERFTSQHKLAESIRLFPWDDQQSYPADTHVAGLGETERQSRAEGAETNEVVTDRTAQARNRTRRMMPPAAELRKAFEDADPDERAFLHVLRTPARTT